jgi:hypothetical protein
MPKKRVFKKPVVIIGAAKAVMNRCYLNSLTAIHTNGESFYLIKGVPVPAVEVERANPTSLLIRNSKGENPDKTKIPRE